MLSEKDEQLGMSHGTAAGRLRKMVMFDMAVESGKNICFRCGELIEHEDDFTLDHKVNWLHASDAKAIFFDRNNIGFSHASCNFAAARCSSKVTSKSGFKGVDYDPRYKTAPFRAILCKRNTEKNRTVHIGRYKTPEEAAIAYDQKAIEAYGERAVTNRQLGLLSKAS